MARWARAVTSLSIAKKRGSSPNHWARSTWVQGTDQGLARHPSSGSDAFRRETEAVLSSRAPKRLGHPFDDFTQTRYRTSCLPGIHRGEAEHKAPPAERTHCKL
jgi:hypothetical protein